MKTFREYITEGTDTQEELLKIMDQFDKNWKKADYGVPAEPVAKIIMKKINDIDGKDKPAALKGFISWAKKTLEDNEVGFAVKGAYDYL